MAILVIDGNGASMNHCDDLDGAIIPEFVPDKLKHLFREKDSFYEFKDNKLTTLYKDFSIVPESFFFNMPMYSDGLSRDSIGTLYSSVSRYCLGDSNDAGKLMGLAPYGTSGVYSHEIFEMTEGRVLVKQDWQKEFTRPVKNYKDFKANFQYYADIAHWTQSQLEKAVLYIVNERSKLVKTKNLAYTGGVALNAVCNPKISENSSFKNLFMTPAAGDNGIGMGCAYYGWLEILKGKRIIHDGNSCFGKNYSNRDIEQLLLEFKVNPNANLNKQGLLNEFFERYKEFINEENILADEVVLKVNIIDSDTYILKFVNGTCTLLRDDLTNTDNKIIADGMSFIKLILNLDNMHEFVDDNVVIEGDLMSILGLLNIDVMKSIMEELQVKFGYKSEKVNFLREKDIVKATASLLAQGKVIGWFQEGCEFGPRALGHRSILADPRKKDIKNFINLQVKFREDFRPFAPSVLLDDAKQYFDLEGESPYMILVSNVKQEWKEKIPGVVHKNNSCRTQTVTPTWNKKYYELIKEFKKQTGVAVLLNTSFNRRGMPIVETPENALSFFYECNLDCLILNEFIIMK